LQEIKAVFREKYGKKLSKMVAVSVLSHDSYVLSCGVTVVPWVG